MPSMAAGCHPNPQARRLRHILVRSPTKAQTRASNEARNSPPTPLTRTNSSASNSTLVATATAEQHPQQAG